MKWAFTILLGVHAIIHFLGFVKAFFLIEPNKQVLGISKSHGALWLLTCILFIISLLQLLEGQKWFYVVFIAVLLSQFLIILVWKDAKFGTILNIVIFIGAIIGLATNNFERAFQKDVSGFLNTQNSSYEAIAEEDIVHLPKIVQEYLNYVGVVGKPRVHNFRITFEGEMRGKTKDWFSFTSEQYNVISDPTRLFFMEAKVAGLPTSGYHRYANGKASMHIKVLSLVPVVKIDDPEIFPTETVTFFNDLCLFAPGALIDNRIQWEAIDDKSVKAIFTTNGSSISAILYFNEKGQLVNFVSEDRMDVAKMKTFPFSTPIKYYQEINGYYLPSYGEAIWHYPDGEFVYGKFRLKSIEYNI